MTVSTSSSSRLRHVARFVLKHRWPELYDRPLNKILEQLDLYKVKLTLEERKRRALVGENEALKRRLRAEVGSRKVFGDSSFNDSDAMKMLFDQLDEFQLKIQVLEQRNAELIELATQDLLTGLPNRRGLERFHAEVSVLTRGMRVREGDEHRKLPRIAAIAIDLDNFKRVNDECGGHTVGDKTLMVIAELMKRCFGHRPEDILCRLGGDEFLVILPQAELRDAYIQASLFLAAVRNDERLHFIRCGFNVTASIGVAQIAVDPTVPSATLLVNLLRMADAATYRAKELGRNCIVRSDAI